MHAASLLTSGSTGAPQPHAKSWRTLVGDVAVAVERLCRVLERPSLEGLTLVATVPVQHSYGLESSVLLAMLGGAAFESGRPFFPADVAQTLASVPRPRALVTTPFHLKTLLLSGIDAAAGGPDPVGHRAAVAAARAAGRAGHGRRCCSKSTAAPSPARSPRAARPKAKSGKPSARSACMRSRRGEGPERFIFEGDFMPEPTPMADVLELLDDRRFRLFGRANDLIHVAGRRSSLAT
jgi:acyl-coenzyme A synthetase/AMP-(fatty) acid ligase